VSTPSSGVQQLLAQLVDLSRDGLLVFDRECRVVLQSAALEHLFDLGPDEILGRSVFEVFPFLGEQSEQRPLQEALQGREGVAEERPFFVWRTGKKGFYTARYRPWFNEKGEVLGGVGVFWDASETRRTREEIQETEDRFQVMADAAPVLLWMAGPDGLCTFFNQTWLDFTGRTQADEWGVGWAEGVHFEDFQRCMDTFIAAFNAREVFEMEYRLRRADGQYRWILDRGAPRFTPDGTFAGYIGSCVDISELKQLEAELRQAVKVRDEFLSIASHELRTPITSLKLQLDSLMRNLRQLPEEAVVTGRMVARNAGAAASQTLKLTELVNVLLDVSRISEGKLALDFEEFDFGVLVEETLRRLETSATAAGCTLMTSLQPGAQGQWDRVRSEQLVANLLSNAIKYGAGKPVEVVLRGDSQSVSLQVTDHGIGIDPEQQDRLFGRFERLVPVRHYGGFGLGLWISRQVVEAHGGRIQVSSEPGRGATFVVTLPKRPVGWNVPKARVVGEPVSRAH
jgi:PAS domain S-box-containing protein